MTRNTTLAFLKSLCRGKWSQVLVYTESEFKKVVTERDRSTSCLVEGCDGALRVLDDFDETGGMVCDSCGVFPDGYEVMRTCDVESLAHEG